MAYRVVPDRQGVINIGKLKENLVTEVEFPSPGFGGGSYAVLLRRPKEDTAYPVSSRHEGNALIWTVQTADTAIAGTGKLECRWYGDNGEVAKSQTYMVRITDGLPDPTEAPEAWEGYIGQVARNAQAAQTAAGEAKASADGAAASAGIAQGAAAEAGKLARAAGDAANAAAAAASAASSAQAGAESAERNARAAADAAETARSGAEASKLAAAESATGAAGSAEAAAQAAQKGENLYNQVKDDLAAGKLKGEKGDPGKDAPQIDDAVISAENPWSSKNIVETLCPPIAESGNPVTCYPVAGYPLGVVAKWEPTQAGSGEPYPAGGGINQLDLSKCTPANPTYGITCTIDGDKIHLKGTITSTLANLQYRLLKVPGDYYDQSGGTHKVFDVKMLSGITPKTVELYNGNTSDKYIVLFMALGGDKSGQDIDLTFRAVRYFGDTAPTEYTPYENIRPISGRESVSVERCGENLMDAPVINTVERGITITTISKGRYRLRGTLSTNGFVKTITKLDLPAGVYTVHISSVETSVTAEGILVTYRKGNGSTTFVESTAKRCVGTLLNPDTIAVTIYGSAGNAPAGEVIDAEIVIGLYSGPTAPTAYTPYQGDTLDLQLPGTVYGGTVDAVTGDGKHEWEYLTFDGAEAWYLNSNKYICLTIPAIAGPPILVCSHFPSKYSYNQSKGIFASSGTIFVSAPLTADYGLDGWKSYLAAQAAAGTPVQIAYKLATPTPIQATGAQPIPALEGCNTILTDADSVAVAGRADPAHAITALQAQLAVATQQLVETQAAMVDTTAMAVDYIYQQDLEDIGLEEVDDSDDQASAEPVDVPGV